eukprot:2777702-Rhodomonas_salina.3
MVGVSSGRIIGSVAGPGSGVATGGLCPRHSRYEPEPLCHSVALSHRPEIQVKPGATAQTAPLRGLLDLTGFLLA